MGHPTLRVLKVRVPDPQRIEALEGNQRAEADRCAQMVKHIFIFISTDGFFHHTDGHGMRIAAE
ncbi:MAG: hypothetical protein EOS23_32465 [Mesorhizobium sp.]|nr:MAG: hypothetical protein EOS23_32465 [Mesorhizobium sp.]